jgi:hypothetical protein
MNRRRKWLAVPVGLLVVLLVLLVVTTQGCASFGGLAEGQRLVRMQASTHWRDGTFVNAEATEVMQEGGYGTLTQWLSSDVMRVPSCQLPMVKDVAARLAKPVGSALRVTWLGHSTTLVELDGAVSLTDPMFSERASPSTLAGPKRFHPPPLALEDLPRIDAVVVSHDHYDHLDMRSIQALAKKGVPIHVGLGAGALGPFVRQLTLDPLLAGHRLGVRRLHLGAHAAAGGGAARGRAHHPSTVRFLGSGLFFVSHRIHIAPGGIAGYAPAIIHKERADGRPDPDLFPRHRRRRRP